MFKLMVRVQLLVAGQALQAPRRLMTTLKPVICCLHGLRPRVKTALVGGGFVGIFLGGCENGLCLSGFRWVRHAKQ